MQKVWIAALILLMALPLLSQAPEPQWTVGTVMGVKPHLPPGDDGFARFDITVRVARTDYVVLYTEQPGIASVEYVEGRDAPVLVGSRTLSLRDKLGRQVDLPILSKKPAGSQPNNL